MNYVDRQYKVMQPNGYDVRTNNGCILGNVKTKQGIVKVYSEFNRSSAEIVINGICYTRYFRRGFTLRGLVTKAAQFAREIAERLHD